MRRILYLLSLLPLIVLSYRIYSQQPIWLTAQVSTSYGNSVQLLLYSSILVYQFNITQPTNLTFIQFTVPEQVLQQQLQYCKTYDPYITSINLSQCDFAYPGLFVLYNSTGSQIGYEISYYTKILSYDNTTGLPQTFQVFVNHHIGNLSPGTYYLYVYYPSPYYFSFESIPDFSESPPLCPNPMYFSVQPPNLPSSSFLGGWCSQIGWYGPGYQPNNPYYYYPYSQSLYYYGCASPPMCASAFCNGLYRPLYIKFNPSYPVIVDPLNSGVAYMVTADPSTGQTCNIGGGVSSLSDLRYVELQYGCNPNQFNEILYMEIYDCPLICNGCITLTLTGFYLEYVPQT